MADLLKALEHLDRFDGLPERRAPRHTQGHEARPRRRRSRGERVRAGEGACHQDGQAGIRRSINATSRSVRAVRFARTSRVAPTRGGCCARPTNTNVAATAVLWADVGLLRQGGQHASARPSAECLARSTPARNFSDPDGRPPVHSGAEHRSRQGHWISPFLKSLQAQRMAILPMGQEQA